MACQKKSIVTQYINQRRSTDKLFSNPVKLSIEICGCVPQSYFKKETNKFLLEHKNLGIRAKNLAPNSWQVHHYVSSTKPISAHYHSTKPMINLLTTFKVNLVGEIIKKPLLIKSKNKTYSKHKIGQKDQVFNHTRSEPHFGTKHKQTINYKSACTHARPTCNCWLPRSKDSKTSLYTVLCVLVILETILLAFV